MIRTGRAEHELAVEVLRSSRALLCVIDGANRLLLVNPAMERFTGRSADDLVGQLFHDVYVVPEHRLLAQDAVARSMATGTAFPQEGDWLAAGGVRRRVSMTIDVLRDADSTPWALACLGLDVTEEREREAALRRRAHTDVLTGLPNRSALFDALQQHLDAERGAGCGLLFCDLDGFKEVNDRHGHAVGDRLLADAAARLLALAGPSDLVARLGGDEFVVVCPGGASARLAMLAAEVTTAFRRPFTNPAGELIIGVSIGHAVGEPGEAPDRLVARADHAMYGAKSRRRRRDPRSPE
ncbi:sensor domain-containing diguanylate cyclase [Modestobacter altitudinis]|uniref:sensor domain-containing diguanylate cyclase n=1 Tax=Modestobacter altitudinis TaxID=2213158 RepID=UPI00110CD9C3|nr:GGDEF domain-containing protein [Modestobacter altitudinis]